MTESQKLWDYPAPHGRDHSWKVACSLLGAAQEKLWKQIEESIPTHEAMPCHKQANVSQKNDL